MGATVLALFTIYRTWWTRPRLSMEIDLGPAPNRDLVETPIRFLEKAETDCGERVSAGEERQSAWVRARVYSAKGVASAAGVVLLGRELDDGETKHRHVLVDGMSLRWAGRIPPTTQIAIPPGLSRHIDIARVTENKQRANVPLVLTTDFQPNDKRHHITRGTLALDLALASGNGPPSFYRVVLRYDGSWADGDEKWRYLQIVSLARRPRRRSMRALARSRD